MSAIPTPTAVHLTPADVLAKLISDAKPPVIGGALTAQACQLLADYIVSELRARGAILAMIPLPTDYAPIRDS